MKLIAIKKSLLIAPIVLGSMLIPITSAHAAEYTIDPRFDGNPNIGVKQTLSTGYSFHHGNAPGLPTPSRNNQGVYVGGYWSGKVTVTAHYMFTSMDKLVMLDVSGRGSDNTATVYGRGFYDANFLAKAGYNSWTEYNIRYPEKDDYNKNDNGNHIMNVLNDRNSNIFFGSIHYNAATSMADPTYLRSTNPGLKNRYVVSADADGKFTPFDAVNRTFVHNNNMTDRKAVWQATRLGDISINSTKNDIKWLNNTTGVTDNTPDHIAPSGQYLINSNHDGDKKMLSWTTGDTNSKNKYFTTGDTVSFRNMSPIIQDGGKNDGLTAFRSNQVFRQSIWIPDGFDYTDGSARLYAIKTDGSRVDATSRASFVLSRASYDSVSNWSADGSTTTDMHRLVATVTNIKATGNGDYNNSSTIGYSLIVPTKVNATAHTDRPYAIRGGSQILNGEWHDSGTDKVYIWNPSKPASTTTSANAIVFNNDSASDFGENTLFYDGGSFANNKTFRSNEDDGYYTWHRMNASAAVPDYVLNDKGFNSSIAPWQSTQPLVFTIPYDNRYVTPIGGMIQRSINFPSPVISVQGQGQNYGWQNAVGDSQTAGTTGQNLRLEGVKIKLNNADATFPGDIEYQAHVQNEGWNGWVKNGQLGGIESRGLQMEALQIRLTGELANNYDVQYRAYVNGDGWQGWVSNGAVAGTTGQGKTMEAVQVRLVKKANGGTPLIQRMNVGTNGITGQDTGSSYVITIPASLVNAYRNQNVDWGAVLKYKVKTNIPGKGVKISSAPSSDDEVSGKQTSGTVYNYLETPSNTFTFDTVSKDGDHLPINQFGSNLNDSVHFVNGQEYGYESQFGNIAKVSGSSGVGEPLKKVQLTASIKPNQIVNAANVYKGNTLVWSGYVKAGQTALQGSSKANINGLSASDWASSFSGTIATSDNNSAHNRTIGVGKTITINASSNLLNNKTALYDADDLRMVLLTDTDDANNQTNLTSNYGDTGNELTGTLTNSTGLVNDSSGTLSQQVSRVKPGAMIVKHGQWPASLNDNGSSINLNSSSIQGREVFDYRLSQFLGNSNLPTEGYATPFSMTAAYNTHAEPTGVSDITVKAYDLAGHITDVTKQFTIAINGGKVSAVMNQDAVNAVTGKVGSAYNKLYVLNVPMKNQTDTASTVRNEIDGSANINGQTVDAPYINEFIPPETPYMYGYSATSASDSFTPSDPEKDKGKIAYGTSDGASTSAQISTAPVQWVIREQLGDMSNPKNPQKYNYAKFNATFPDAALFQNGSNVTWHVYNESGTDVSSKFTGSATTGSGFKIQASDSFLKDMSNYNHKYYFVINQTTQNSHANRLAMATKAGLGNVFSAFRSLKSAMTAFFGAVGIGNTDKTVATQNFDMQSDLNLLQVNSTKSGLNEKMSELNTNPFTNGKYNIQNVALARPLSGYTITGAASQYATDARKYESYTTSFTANGADTAQAVTPGSVKIIDSVTNTDVTSEYNVTVSDQKVIVVASQKALDRLHGYHKTAANANAQDIVTFHVGTWGSRQSDTVATWYATHNINGYNDAQSVERVTIPQAHAGHKEIYVSPAGQNKWQTTDMTLNSISEAVDLKIRVTVPNDLHNKDMTDFIAHYVGSEITPFVNQADATATVMLGENNDYSKGSVMVPTNATASSKSLNDSRVLWELPSTLVAQLNTTNAINAAPTYTVIIHNIRFTPTSSRTIDQYTSYLTKDNQVVIPVGGVTTSSNGSQAPMDGNYFEGRNGGIVDSTIGSLGSGATLGTHSGKINIILSTADARQEGYVNGGESNTSFTRTGSN